MESNHQDSIPTDLISAKKACELLVSPRTGRPIHRKTLIAWANADRIRAWKHGPHERWWMFSRAEVLALVQPVAVQPKIKRPTTQQPRTPAWANKVLERAGYH